SLCNIYGFKPTYLCTYEIVYSKKFDTILNSYQEQGVAEIGAHLHPWTTPPFEDIPQNACSHPYPSELSLKVFQEKMESLTDSIYSKSGLKPKSYRAGRYGFCALHIPILLKLGYKVDCSVTPQISWEHILGRKEGGPDFRNAPVEPYFLDLKDASLSGKSKLLEAPVTILFSDRMARSSRKFREVFLKYENTLMYKIMRKIFRLYPRWFRPWPHMTARDLINVYRTALTQ